MKLELIGKRSTNHSLDELWQAAEAIGRIEVDWDIFKEQYKVKICFKRNSGSDVWAVGFHKNIHIAFDEAIGEARDLQ